MIPISKGRIIVTGSSGLVCSNLIDLLMYANTKQGFDFHLLVIGRDVESLKLRFGNNPKINYMQIDLSEEQTIDIDEKYDFFIHGAAIADPILYAKKPTETMLTNLNGTIAALDYCKHTGCRLLFLSSFEIYGSVVNQPIREIDYGPVNIDEIRSSYSESKKCSEMLIKAFVEEYGVDGVIARLCSIYGPTMKINDNKAHSQFMMSGLKSQNIIMKSKGEQKRSYCYVFDVVSAILYILSKGEKGKAYNVSDDSIITIRDVAEIISNLCNVKVIYQLPTDLEKKGYSKGKDSVLDNSKLKTLGWKPLYDPKSGFTNCIDIMRESYGY